jgi:hypothetical protein
MNRWLKRIGYFLFLLLWLMVMAFPTFAFFLATNGEVQLGSEPRSHLRFFMVQEEASSGVGIEWVRGARQVDDCTRTTIRYFLWEGSSAGQNVTFCQCYNPVTDAPLPTEESICTP